MVKIVLKILMSTVNSTLAHHKNVGGARVIHL
jgi:hypothetical protein